ncbi:flagellar biosynthesis protein FlhA [Rickettsiales bacterium]|nr:flagellar biosynthesis protein FlhA [Rickettsiales bacterium]
MADAAADQVMESPTSSFASVFNIFKQTDVMFAMAIVGILIVLLIPVPTFLLDLLLGVSITFTVMILMTVLFIERPLEFSTFPTILLIAALFRLSLNIASTRLILSEGHTGSDAAGNVIEAFGGFVMAGSVVIGIIIFGILTIINFVVITKGSGRIAEVAARFSLDAMPGKQMAIDADLSAGLIDEAEAKDRRKQLEDESAFFGSMDGASKFVRGDAIAGLLITFINLIGGIIIGTVQQGLEFSQAMESYTMLTIGDGLVSQIPSLIVSTSAGLLVSKAGVTGSADKAIIGQFSKYPKAINLSSALMGAMAFMPSIPAVPFVALSALLGFFSWQMKKAANEAAEEEFSGSGSAKGGGAQSQRDMTMAGGGSAPKAGGGAGGGKAAAPVETEEESISKALQIDSIRIELGYGLLPLVNYEKGSKLPDQVKALRKQLARDIGFVMPSVRIQDNMQLQTHEYIVRIKDIECARGEIRPDMLLVMDPKGGEITIPGEDTKEPAFGLPAKWISESAREEALFRNYTVVDPPTVVTTHLTEVIKDNVTELLTFSETKKLLDGMDDSHKKLIEETIPEKISIGGVQRVLQNLLAERVSIRDLPAILEAISEATTSTKSITMITEHVRGRLSRLLSNENLGSEGYVPLLVLSPKWEQAFAEGLQGEGEDLQLSIPPSHLQEFITAVKRAYQEHAMRGDSPVLLTSPMIRPYVRSVIERFRSSTVVMSQNEIHPKVKIKTLGQI